MLRKLTLGILKKMKFLPASTYMKIYYEYYTGKKLNLENPEEFNEKIAKATSQLEELKEEMKVLNKI